MLKSALSDDHQQTHIQWFIELARFAITQFPLWVVVRVMQHALPIHVYESSVEFTSCQPSVSFSLGDRYARLTQLILRTTCGDVFNWRADFLSVIIVAAPIYHSFRLRHELRCDIGAHRKVERLDENGPIGYELYLLYVSRGTFILWTFHVKQTRYSRGTAPNL